MITTQSRLTPRLSVLARSWVTGSVLSALAYGALNITEATLRTGNAWLHIATISGVLVVARTTRTLLTSPRPVAPTLLARCRPSRSRDQQARRSAGGGGRVTSNVPPSDTAAAAGSPTGTASNAAGTGPTAATSGFLARSGTSYWASLERLFTSPASKTCNMWIWLKATSTTSGHIKFNVEIIEPVSFTYVALKPVEYSNNTVPFGYAKYVVGPWRTTTHQQLLFRVSLFGAAGPFGDAAFIDDTNLYCA